MAWGNSPIEVANEQASNPAVSVSACLADCVDIPFHLVSEYQSLYVLYRSRDRQVTGVLLASTGKEKTARYGETEEISRKRNLRRS